TADKSTALEAWAVEFFYGSCVQMDLDNDPYVRAVR
ncbi:MAG: hypothetical protein GWN16_03065, partial [Calditrichae bacterium]|nr:hypothetical protein [Calditrichia bacterium]